MVYLSEDQRRMLSSAVAAGSYRAGREADQARARKLNGKGLFARDKQDGYVWRPTDEGRRMAAQFAPCVVADAGRDGAAAAETSSLVDAAPSLPAVSQHFAPPDLAETVSRARQLLDEGDVEKALKLSAVAYDQARAAANSAERVRASRELVDKARRMQADALTIESMCYVAMADAVDDAQAKGQLSRGRPEKVHNADHFTLEDVGVDKRRLHEARKLRDAVRAEPDFVERVVEARLSEGLEPNRAALKKAAGHAIGTKAATKEEKGDQLYETPIEAMRTLLALESFSGTVKEPAVGKGAIMRPLEDAGYEVMIADLVDRGIATRHGVLQQVGDFVLSVAEGSIGVDIVSNPPYGDVVNAFVAHALREHKPRKMALLLNFNFAAGFDDPNRCFVMDESPPSRIYLFKHRLPMMHRDGWDGNKASSQMNTAWFVWERNDDGNYGDGYPRLIRVDWENFETAEPLAPGAGGNVSPMGFRAAPEDDEFARSTPRKTLDERVDEERANALIWIAEQDGFDAVTLRRGVGIRPSVAEALISEFSESGLIAPADDNQWNITDAGWLVLKATAAVLVVAESEAA